MGWFLLLTDKGVNTRPVQADTGAELLAALRAEGATKVAAIELLTVTDMDADGNVPQAFLTGQANRATLLARAEAALTANATFLALPAPGNAAVLAQVQTLTKECNALIRLLLGQLDSTAGTGAA